tara:strand:- start:1407 stop:1814 length:408 start_codon:yes stop_codon:yes gene_type:complete
MTLKNLLTLCITFSFFASSQLEAAGPSTVEAELAKQKKYASDLMVSIDSGKYQGKQLEALKILHQKILDFPIPTQAQLDARYANNQEKIAQSIIDRDTRRMAILPMNADNMEKRADAIDRNARADSRGAGSSTPD